MSTKGNAISHEAQRQKWEAEHASPTVLLPMDSDQPSSGVVKFWQWNPKENLRGLEMGCGKGRNSIWLAQQGASMSAFDFSKFAIIEAKKRAGNIPVDFQVADATEKWPYPDNQFDFAIDCFASTDIESPEGRAFAAQELLRVLKPGGRLLVYALSTDDEFHKKMLNESPGPEKNTFLHPKTGKFEKVFGRQELLDLYRGFEVEAEERVNKQAEFFGKMYNCKHFWFIFKKA